MGANTLHVEHCSVHLEQVGTLLLSVSLQLELNVSHHLERLVGYL